MKLPLRKAITSTLICLAPAALNAGTLVEIDDAYGLNQEQITGGVTGAENFSLTITQEGIGSLAGH